MSEVTTLQTEEIKRQDLLRMSRLSTALDDNDMLFLTSRGELDAVMARPDRLLAAMELGGAATIRKRLQQDNIVDLTEYDVAILNAISELGDARLKAIGNAVGRSVSNIHGRLQVLVTRGVIERVEADRNITYRITDTGREAIAAE